MSRSLTAFLTGAALAVTSYASDVGGYVGPDPNSIPVGVTWQAPATRPATTQPATTQPARNYVPKTIDSPATKKVRSSQNARIDETASTVEINGSVYIRYENTFAQENEMGFMLRLPEDRQIVYSINGDGINANVEPTFFYIPTKAADEKGVFFTSIDLGKRNGFNLETTILGDTEFFTPEIDKRDNSLPFYLAGAIPGKDNVITDREGTTTVLAPNGVYSLNGISAEAYTARVNAHNNAEAQKLEEEQRRLEAEKQAAEAAAKEAAPGPGKVQGLGHKK
jgi:hypothetical protein